MRFAVLGTGNVGATVGRKLVELGQEVMMGARQAGNERAVAWAESLGEGARQGSFRDAASFAETVVNATAGRWSLDALNAAGSENLDGKVLIDLANPLNFDAGFPPTLTVVNTDSLGEQIQHRFPQARVVKTLNTINAAVMVDPSMILEDHSMFVAGNDADAKAEVVDLLETFGWNRQLIIDLGDISSARGMEMYLSLWLRLARALQTGHINVRVLREG
jgi:predicted dinucleotide-binding enzyme